jgi:general secretion pathway protein D
MHSGPDRRQRQRILPAVRVLLLVALVASALPAQDSAAVRRTEQGVLVDFQDVELRFVITALAEAANLNVSYGELPSRRITLRLRQAVQPAAVPALLRSLALSNGLRYFEENGLIRLEASEMSLSPLPSARDTAAAEVRLFVYQLKHARAARMAATMQAIFGGGSGGSFAAPGLSHVPLSDRLRGEAIPPVAETSAPAAVSATAPNPAGAPLLAQLRGDIQIVPDESTNSLLVRALPSDWATVRAAVDAMDLRPLQVLIEVVIAELRTTDDSQLGISANVEAGSGNTQGAELKSSVAGDFILTMTQRGPTFSADVALAALTSRGNVRILSRPLLLAQNNQEARILVGEQRPFVQVFRSLPTDNAIRDQVVQYRDVATTLTIRPTINPDGYVNLQVLQEVSTATDATQFGAPIISTREASTHLFVRDGRTAVLGGLVSRQTDRVRSGIPILSRLPLIGALFGSTTDKETTSELFLFLTPHVVASDEDADRIRDGLQRQGTDTTGVKPVERPVVPPRDRP